MPEQTVSSGFLRALLDFAVSKGAARTALLESADVSESELLDRDSRIPFAKYIALMRAAKTLTNDPALAIQFGEQVDVDQISVVGLIGKASNTMLDAFTQLNRYVRLIVDIETHGDERFALQRDAEGLWFTDLRANANDFPELTESAFLHVVTGPRRAGVPESLKEVRVTHPPPAYRAEYERAFRVPVKFNADRNALRLDEAIVEYKVGVLPHYVFGVLVEHADALLSELDSAKTTRGRVESLLMPILHTGELSMDAIAATLGVSRQTLYRDLKAEDVTFEQVLDDLRHKLALEYLRAKKVSVNETAYLVGFSDPASFSRAFKRWTGKSPREYRGS